MILVPVMIITFFSFIVNANQNKSITNKRTVHNIPALDVTKNGDIVKINKENRLNIFNFFDVEVKNSLKQKVIDIQQIIEK